MSAQTPAQKITLEEIAERVRSIQAWRYSMGW